MQLVLVISSLSVVLNSFDSHVNVVKFCVEKNDGFEER